MQPGEDIIQYGMWTGGNGGWGCLLGAHSQVMLELASTNMSTFKPDEANKLQTDFSSLCQD